MDGIKLPKGFIESLAPLLNGETQDFLRSYEQPYYRGLRLNKPLSHPDISKEIPWEKSGRYLKNESILGAGILHEAGGFYIQEPSAMVPAAVLNPRPGEWVLDLCAAPGGKATQLAAYLKGEGLLVANEPVLSRARVLAQNLERMGVSNSLCTSALPETLALKWPNLFDAVLVDAPCSGEGMFRRHPETRLQWHEDSPAGCAKRQKEILRSAIAMLKKGGRLLYSTCTLNSVENEGVIRWVLETYPDMRLMPFELAGGIDGRTGMCRLWPHKIKGEGHFAALLTKDAGEGKPLFNRGLLPAPKGEIPFPLAVKPTGQFMNTLVFLPEYPDVSGVKVLRAGLHLGEMRGKVFVPDHALSKTPFCSLESAALNAAEANAYLRGETLAREGKGWQIATYEGLPLGFVKASEGQFKNHYPKGLRKALDR